MEYQRRRRLRSATQDPLEEPLYHTGHRLQRELSHTSPLEYGIISTLYQRVYKTLLSIYYLCLYNQEVRLCPDIQNRTQNIFVQDCPPQPVKPPRFVKRFCTFPTEQRSI